MCIRDRVRARVGGKISKKRAKSGLGDGGGGIGMRYKESWAKGGGLPCIETFPAPLYGFHLDVRKTHSNINIIFSIFLGKS